MVAASSTQILVFLGLFFESARQQTIGLNSDSFESPRTEAAINFLGKKMEGNEDDMFYRHQGPP